MTDEFVTKSVTDEFVTKSEASKLNLLSNRLNHTLNSAINNSDFNHNDNDDTNSTDEFIITNSFNQSAAVSMSLSQDDVRGELMLLLYFTFYYELFIL